jgi:hypothetical protein
MDKRERAQHEMREQTQIIRKLQERPGTWLIASQLRRPPDNARDKKNWPPKGEVAKHLANVHGVLFRKRGKTKEWCWDPNVPVTNGIVVEG